MPTITIFRYNKYLNADEIIEKLNKKLNDGNRIKSSISKFYPNEIFIEYTYMVNITEILRKVLEEAEIEFLLETNSNLRDINLYRIVYAFINIENQTIEIYTGSSKLINKILEVLKENLNIEIQPAMNLEKITYIPNIHRFADNSIYSVTVKGNKIYYNSPSIFKFRPRFELRQIVNQLICQTIKQ
jgi:hypothetical protein